MAIRDLKHTYLDEIFVTKYGAKICRIRGLEDEFIITPSTYLRLPFDASNFDKDPEAQRLSLAIETDDELKNVFTVFDAWVVQYMAEHSVRIFKKEMTLEQVKACYNSCLKESKEPYPPILKCKIDKGNRKGICCWSPSGHRVDPPGDWRTVLIKPRLHVSHVWLNNSTCGVVIQITDAEVIPRDAEPKPRENPFK